MTTTDWIIDIALLLIVVRQLREAELGPHLVLLPLGMVAWTASHFLRSVPTAGNDLVLIVTLALIGVAFGVAGGLLTRVRVLDGRARIRAGFWAATLWIASMGARMAFFVYATHGGADAVARFSAAHQITSAQAWVTAFVLMAIAEVTIRIAMIVARGLRAQAADKSFAVQQPARIRVAA